MRIDAVILARGGSKGIPDKNIVDFCNKPLIAWTIEQCLSAESVTHVWVSSDSDKILKVAREYGAKIIRRPADISDEFDTSESGWLHAINHIEKETGPLDLVLAPQVTSPLRVAKDFERGITTFINGNYDSLFSCAIANDLFFWKKNLEGELNSVNYDYHNRLRRQDISEQFIENGSFYIFLPEILRKFNNRLGGKVGYVKMELWKMFEIDMQEDIRMCSILMEEYLLRKN